MMPPSSTLRTTLREAQPMYIRCSYKLHTLLNGPGNGKVYTYPRHYVTPSFAIGGVLPSSTVATAAAAARASSSSSSSLPLFAFPNRTFTSNVAVESSLPVSQHIQHQQSPPLNFNSTNVDSISTVYTFGAGSFGGLGHGSYLDAEDPKRILIPPITQLSIGWCGNSAITGTGHLFFWGYKPFLRSLVMCAKFRRDRPALLRFLQKYKFGRITFDNAIVSPSIFEQFGNDAGCLYRAQQVACGGDFQAVLDTEGNVHTWGSGFFGQLGHSSDIMSTLLHEPKMIEFFKENNIKIRKIACGFHHLMMIAEDGSLYACGKCDFGQLGMKVFSEGKRLMKVALVPATSDEVKQKEIDEHLEYTDAELLELEENLRAGKVPARYIGKVRDISCGMKHTVAIMADGSVYASGKNAFGQLGIVPQFHDSQEFMKVAIPQNERVVKIACGQHHTLFLCESGAVYACGLNKQGQCGQTEENSKANPILLDRKRTAANVNEFLCVPIPTQVIWPGMSLKKNRVVNICAGFYDSALILDDGSSVWMGGHLNENGFHFPRLCYPDFEIKDVHFGLAHCAIVGRRRHLNRSIGSDITSR